MDKPNNLKSKNKKLKSDKEKQTKKRKCEGSTCSTFLSELTQKFKLKKKQQEVSRNIVQSIISSITSALPIQFSMKSLKKSDSPVRLETLQSYAPELILNNTKEFLHANKTVNEPVINEATFNDTNFRIPKMPLMNKELLKTIAKKPPIPTKNVAVHTTSERDVAGEIAKYVATLRKISLIAEEFNQKTAKNLKEIVDSVQEDLMKKLKEVEAEQHASSSKSEKQLHIKN